MPIKFTPIARESEWVGTSWEITSDDQLAQLVARVALGQSHYALRVLKETGFISAKVAATTLPGAIKLLTAANPKEPYHRDGWLFQVISWIAAHLQEPDGLIMEPHMIHAHKGFDGVHVRMKGTTGGVDAVVVCEEKATKNARKMVRDRIWKEFEDLEKGDSDHRLLSEVLVILKSRGGIDLDKAIEQLVWNNARAYGSFDHAALAYYFRSQKLSRRQVQEHHEQITPYLSAVEETETWNETISRVEDAIVKEVNAR